MPFVVVLNFFFAIFLCSPSIVNASIKDDKALVAFVKGPDKFGQFCTKKGVTNEQSKEMLAQIYGTHLGILYFMKKNWHCAEMKKEAVEPKDQKECDHLRECLDNLYEYLYKVHTGQSVLKRIFLKNFGWIMICVVRALFGNWKIFFRPELLRGNGGRQIISNVSYSRQLQKLLSKFCGKRSGDGSELRQTEFDKIMEKMFKKLEQQRANVAKNGEKLAMMANASSTSATVASTSLAFSSASSSSSSPSENAAIFLDTLLDLTPVYYITKALRDEAFLRWVETDDLRREIDKKKGDYFNKKGLGILYLLRKHWHCANAIQNQFFDQNQCEKFRQYLDLLHEYLFRLHYGFAKGKPRPIFQLGEMIERTIDTVDTLDFIGEFYFDTTAENREFESWKYFPAKTIDQWTHYSSLKLLNEEEMDYLTKKDKAQISYQKAVVDLANQPINGRKISAAAFNDLRVPQVDQKRHEFDAKLAAFSKKAWISWVHDTEHDGDNHHEGDDDGDNHDNSDEENHDNANSSDE